MNRGWFQLAVMVLIISDWAFGVFHLNLIQLALEQFAIERRKTKATERSD